MKYTIEQILDWEYCGCGRSWCVVFDGSIGERGSSISEDELLSIIEELQKNKHYKKSSITKAVNHIRDLLAKEPTQ